MDLTKEQRALFKEKAENVLRICEVLSDKVPAKEDTPDA